MRYRITNLSAQPHDDVLVVENELHPGLLEVMNHGRGTLAYWDGGDTSAAGLYLCQLRAGDEERTRNSLSLK